MSNARWKQPTRSQARKRTKLGLRRLFFRMARERAGVAAVEFAFILPIFVLMLGGIVEASLVFHAKTTLTHHIREASRGVALGYMTEAEAKTYLDTHFNDRLAVPVTTQITVDNGNPQLATVEATISGDGLNMYRPFGFFTPDTVQDQVTMVVVKLKE